MSNPWHPFKQTKITLQKTHQFNGLVEGKNYRKTPWSSWENLWFPVKIFPTKPIHWSIQHGGFPGKKYIYVYIYIYTYIYTYILIYIFIHQSRKKTAPLMSEQRSSPLGVRNDLSRDRSEVLAVRNIQLDLGWETPKHCRWLKITDHNKLQRLENVIYLYTYMYILICIYILYIYIRIFP